MMLSKDYIGLYNLNRKKQPDIVLYTPLTRIVNALLATCAYIEEVK